MMENHENNIDNRKAYRNSVSLMGKKEFTLAKMQEYGFWPEGVPTPYERQQGETDEDFLKRKELISKYDEVVNNISDIYKEKEKINEKLQKLRKKYDDTWDYEKIRKDVSKIIMQESIERRKKIKEQRKLEAKEKSDKYKKYKSENIIFIGKDYSNGLSFKDTNEERLKELGLPVIKDDKELANFLNIEYKELRYLTYHRDVVRFDNYARYTIPKKKGGVRNIAAPKKVLKTVQRRILEEILLKIEINECANGFVKGKSIVSGAKIHNKENNKIKLLINMDLENFFPTITFKRVRGMFESFGYSAYVSSLLAMICTYCERMKIEVKGEELYVKTSYRILPQGAPSSPMITNIICKSLDNRLSGLALKYDFNYSRYADDMSFSFNEDNIIFSEKTITTGKILGMISKIIKEEGFNINKSKTKFLRENNRQAVTGIVINNGDTGVSRKWVKKLRAAVFNASKLKESGINIPFEVRNEIRGMASYLESVNKDRYSKIIDECNKLLN